MKGLPKPRGDVENNLAPLGLDRGKPKQSPKVSLCGFVFLRDAFLSHKLTEIALVIRRAGAHVEDNLMKPFNLLKSPMTTTTLAT